MGFRQPRLADELARYRALNNRSRFPKLIAKADLLLIDDFGSARMPDKVKRDLLEILDDRDDRKPTLITSELPVDQRHAYLAALTLVDAILDQLVHNSYRLALTGAFMRKQKTTTKKPVAARKS